MAPPSPSQDGSQARLLVMDDDRDLCDLLSLRLSPSMEVVCAHDGERGIMIAQAFPPHVFLIDVFMPKLSGLSVLRYLKHQSRFHSTPVILMTAHQHKLADPEAIRGQTAAVLLKPFDVAALQALLGPLLAQRTAPTPEPGSADPRTRRAPRVALQVPAVFTGGGARIEGAISSLSPMGALFESAAPLPAEEGELGFTLDDVKLRLQAVVLYRGEHAGITSTGIRLRAVTLDEESLLWRHVEGLHAGEQRERLSRGLVERFRGLGFSVLAATVDGMKEPRRVRRYAPDVLAFHEAREVICFGVSLPGFLLAEARSGDVIEELAGQKMADGVSRGQVMPVTIAVPTGWLPVAKRLVSGLDLSAQARQALAIVEL